MKTFTAIREDLRNIRYYYSRRDEMTQTAKIVGECKVLKTVEEYNEIVCQAPPKLYELYSFLFDIAVRQWARSISRNVSNANIVAMEYVNGQIRLSEK